ncbi:SHUGOSHIN 2-like isoform X2 [Cucurbita maxima]|uniref:SHUGOSHIN 2-like isoform X2 n=1 Tax=Cucurbita maxima TaxID=3661 RepID=A0A6J1JRT6_CUCMA|nr:SHUGOSHIN 2-like isoform X2 [Cucurbita maxima]
MEGIISHDSENYDVGGQNMKLTGEKIMKSCKVGDGQRKQLSDISNLKEQPIVQKRDMKQQPSLLMNNEYVDKLQKENMALMRVLAERNRIIEISGNELEKLRINFQKLQQQNLQLAQANSQMLAELNSSKDRLKAFQHELGCKNGVLMARNLDLERKGKLATLQTGEVGTTKCSEAEESMNADKDNKPCKTNRRRKSRRESFGASVLQTEVQKVEGKRPCFRRQSAKFKTEESVAAKDILETKNSSSTDASQCIETSILPAEVQKAEGKRPCFRRQSTRFKTEESVAAKDILETENSNSTCASQCIETSILPVEVQKAEGKRPCSRRQSERLKTEEPVGTNDLFDIENSKSTNTSQCKETSILQTEVQKVEGERPCSRRQSARFKPEEPMATQDLPEIENSTSTSASQCKDIVCELVTTSTVERKDHGNSTDKSEVQECRRSSVGRPLRRAVEKVQSYKEIPRNIKMRRQV